ncbi:Oidioi.mRNA.OKI2018_I69.XSR.g13662.t1.cds [Oikopleura dioica]|uniref:Oidioi.mRNA.OKI2018_I69.XSR.g13662.t1.cds n=1 Tax=Oikopleura dioica TaxID=34765 RepID=A0ABN7S7I8_OIKDI|nr:Oidioi.mRNA.OKI2018_I69.XSR.g13662.t1.cds [Oikopleura dioica]
MSVFEYGRVQEAWKDKDGIERTASELLEPEHIGNKEYLMRVDMRTDAFMKGRIAFGPKGVKKPASVGEDQLVIFFEPTSFLEAIIDGNKLKLSGNNMEALIIKPGRTYALKNPAKEIKYFDFTLLNGPFGDINEESNGEISLTEHTEYDPEATEEATQGYTLMTTDGSEKTGVTEGTTRVSSDEFSEEE